MKKPAVFVLVFLAVVFIITAGCVGEQIAKDGDSVSVYYTLTTDTGYTESNVGTDNTLTFIIGSGSVVNGFNDGVVGMKVGDTKTVVVAPKDGYGERTNDIVKDDLKLSDVEEYLGRSADIGDTFDIIIQQGNSITPLSAQILTIDRENDKITYSVNKRHAGETLTFEITLASIN